MKISKLTCWYYSQQMKGSLAILGGWSVGTLTRIYTFNSIVLSCSIDHSALNSLVRSHGDTLIEKRMADNFSQVKTLERLVRKHVVQQLFEVGAEWRAIISLMRSPEGVMFARCDEEVVLVVAICLAEWHDSGAHRENDDAEGEQVRRDGLVAHAHRDFGRHVAG